jgi:hypothetical protein
MAHDFASLLFHTTHRVPSYQAWLDGIDQRWVYASHRRQLQYLQWKAPAARWVLKSPGHLWTLDALLAEYPDARIVQTHRDPLRVIASLVSLVTYLRGLASDAIDPHEIGADWTARLAAGLGHTMDVRARGLLPLSASSTSSSATSSAASWRRSTASTRTSGLRSLPRPRRACERFSPRTRRTSTARIATTSPTRAWMRRPSAGATPATRNATPSRAKRREPDQSNAVRRSSRGHQPVRRTSCTTSKWVSLLSTGSPCSRASAAIHVSFTGIGVPAVLR